MGSLYLALALFSAFFGGAWAHGPECGRALQAGVTTSFLLLPRGGHFHRLSPPLEKKELAKLASGISVRFLSVQPHQRRVVSQVDLQSSEQWLKRLRAHPRVIGVQQPISPAPVIIDRRLQRYMKSLPVGTSLEVAVTLPDEETARPFLELILRRRLLNSPQETWQERAMVKPVRSLRTYADRIEILLEDPNDRMREHLQLLVNSASSRVRAELVSAY